MSEQHAGGSDFRPQLIQMRGGAQYMRVADRAVWLHQQTAAGLDGATGFLIETEPHTITERIAIFRATVTVIGDGGVVIRRTTATGTETPADFGDYVEKAETKALGRALGWAGFGTANLEDEAAPDGRMMIADAPRDARQGNPAPVQNTMQAQQRQASGPPGAATQRQIAFLSARAAELGLDDEELHRHLRTVTGKASRTELTRQDASKFIDYLNERSTGNGAQRRPAAVQAGPPDDAPPPDEPAF